MSAFTVICLPPPPHSLPSDWQSAPPAEAPDKSPRPAVRKQESAVNVGGKKAEVYIYKVRLKHLISAQHKFCSRKSKRWMSIVSSQIGQCSIVTRDMVIMVS